ncbi:hypothetical protein COY07_02965 [Candidatus Peregrinibacteria bacterium CG_4_10_14_0_2_um_filter_43_11]|nr:MAG: hypothetical protein COY07_02965 [Candidatus Peregrinibacteria bacterium CG_4_10_14_0_2_um_filter_43_11]
MDFVKLFKNLGLQDKEPEVYLALLKLPGVQPASVVANHTGLNRTTVYKTLIKLAKMGLATKTMRRGILCFYAEDPSDNLENVLVERKKQIDSLHQELITALPGINELKKQEMLSPKMRYYEGIEGLKRVYEDTLIESNTIYAFENVATMAPEVNDFIFTEYVKRRVEKGIFAHVITPKNKSNQNFQKDDKKAMRKTKFVSKTPFPLEVEINIYGNKTAFFSYKKEEMFGAILESESIASSMRAIFNFCWQFVK